MEAPWAYNPIECTCRYRTKVCALNFKIFEFEKKRSFRFFDGQTDEQKDRNASGWKAYKIYYLWRFIKGKKCSHRYNNNSWQKKEVISLKKISNSTAILYY